MSETGYLFGGDWTQDKLEMVSKYLSAYSTIMKEQPFKFAYIDAFAGAGYMYGEVEGDEPSLFPAFEEEDSQEFLEGSARRALETEPEFDTYIFVELDSNAAEELETLRGEYPRRDIRIINSDANEWLIRICRQKDWTQHRAVVFLDPYGMQVRWDTIRAIASTEAIDVWILFPLGIAVNRLLVNNGEISDGWKEKLNSVFGTDEWEGEFYESNPNLFGDESKAKTIDLEGIGEYYNNRLKKLFAEVAENPKPLYNSSNNPLYLLCFAAANPKGAPTAVKVAQHILGN